MAQGVEANTTRLDKIYRLELHQMKTYISDTPGLVWCQTYLPHSEDIGRKVKQVDCKINKEIYVGRYNWT